jgi:hypothetical protein
MKPSDVIVGLISDIAQVRVERFNRELEVNKGMGMMAKMMGSTGEKLLEQYKIDPHTYIAAIIAYLDQEWEKKNG